MGLLLMTALPALAEDAVDCSTAETQADMNLCADQDYQVADDALNGVYKQAMSAMQKTDAGLADIGEGYVGAVAALKKAQRAWITYRDGQCELAGFSARGGSMEPMLVSGCLAEMTGKRTAELKTLIEELGN